MSKVSILIGGAIALYAPIELTRLIVKYWQRYGLVKPFWFELIWIWIGVIVLFYFWFVAYKKQGEVE